jgi:hypothetical protein
MRSVSAMAAAGHPHVGGAGKVGPHGHLGAVRLAVDAILPRPGMVRRSFSTAAAACASATGSSPVSTNWYFSPEPPRPTLLRTRQFGQRGAHLALDDLLARALAPLVQQHGQCGLAHLGAGATGKGVRAHGAAAGGGVDAFTCGTLAISWRACSAAMGLRQRGAGGSSR